MDPMKYDFKSVKEDEVRYYTPGESLCISEWYCENCEEFVGYPYMDETHAKTCDDAIECPYSEEWNGDACGYVVCKWCHSPAVTRYRKWTDQEEVETLATVIGLNEGVSML